MLAWRRLNAVLCKSSCKYQLAMKNNKRPKRQGVHTVISIEGDDKKVGAQGEARRQGGCDKRRQAMELSGCDAGAVVTPVWKGANRLGGHVCMRDLCLL